MHLSYIAYILIVEVWGGWGLYRRPDRQTQNRVEFDILTPPRPTSLNLLSSNLLTSDLLKPPQTFEYALYGSNICLYSL